MMIKRYVPLVLAAACAFAEAGTALGNVPERADIPEASRWDLEAIYPSLEAWETAFDTTAPRVDAQASYAGRLGEGEGATLLAFLKEDEAVSLELGKLYVYANMKSHEDLRLTRPMELAGRVESLMVRYGAATAFVTPELLALPEAELKHWAEGPELRLYRLRKSCWPAWGSSPLCRRTPSAS